jgi:hypothetical protein
METPQGDHHSVFARLVSEATAAGLPYLLIGGNAVVGHGYQRMTRDIDLLIHDRNRQQWDALIMSLGYQRHDTRDAFHMYNAVARGDPPLDLMLVDASTFAKLSTDPAYCFFDGVKTPIPRLSHLLALKLHALKHYIPHRYERDLGDVVELIRINRVNLADPEFAGIFERYAIDSVRREIERRLARPESSDS